MPPIHLAIIDSNFLVCIGLQQLLKSMLPIAEIHIFRHPDEMHKLKDLHFIHLFVAASVYFENINFFRDYPGKIIILVNGDIQINGVYTINVCQDGASLMSSIKSMQTHGHSMVVARRSESSPTLSPREIEVAVLLCKGLTNKEIANRLFISITTVITHRKNIMSKLKARSLADVITYCVIHGLVRIEEMSLG